MLEASTSAPVVFSTTIAVLCAAYAVFAPFFRSTKQTAWILSTICSGTMAACSLPFVADYLKGGIESVDGRVAFAVLVNRIFQVYLFTDLAVGAVFYRSQINLLTGWVHHIVYMGICQFAISHEWGWIFALSAIMELPTFLLGLGTLFPRLRSNVLFAVTFFATRIALHVLLIVTMALPAHRPQGSLAPAMILVFAFPMHAMWFVGCVKGFIRRAEASKARARTVVPVVAKPSSVLAPDVHLDARSLLRHANTVPVLPPWDVTLRFRRLRAGVKRWVWQTAGGTQNGPVAWVRESPVSRWASARRPLPLPLRPARLARRMSDGIINVLPSKEAMLDFVGLGGVAR
uniref:TLC domain-containing protein n=1 Tax=Mycena chlorophos TaxID=658473 RepID=A0ABQ0MC43_MYCCL|nr:predicted protein [Mycena chlorophos]